DFNVIGDPRRAWTTTNNVNFMDVPAGLQHGTGFNSILTNANSGVDHDQQSRAFFHADATTYFHAAGEHQLKFGVQADRVGNNVLRGELRPIVTLRWGVPLALTRNGQTTFVQGPYGYYSVRS